MKIPPLYPMSFGIALRYFAFNMALSGGVETHISPYHQYAYNRSEKQIINRENKENDQLTELTKGSYASATRYAKVVPESTMVPRLFDVKKAAGSIGNCCPLTAMLCRYKL